MAGRDNYFILTGVSFDPIETNEQKIKDAIANKQQEWSKDQNNPLKRNKAMENLRILKDIEAVLLDSNQRLKEAEQAKIIRKTQLSTLEEKIKITEARGYIKPKELDSIVKKFKEFGISEAEIKKMVTKPISETKPVVTEQEEELELIDQQMAANIEKNFKQLGGTNNTLYSFLEIKESASQVQLIEAAEARRKTLGSRVEKTGNLNAELELAGICLIVFKDNNSKRKYDNYLSITKYTKLNEAIKEGAINNKKEINDKLMEALLDVAVKNYQISISEGSAYIKKYCMINGYIVSGGEKVSCGLCKTENAFSAVTCSKCGKPLQIECPSCHAKNGNAAEKCSKCMFDLSKMNQAMDLITNAKKCLSNKKIDDAITLISEAKIFWPNHPDIIEIDKVINQQKQQFDTILASIVEEIKAKNYYSAKTKIMQSKNNGFQIEKSIVDKVESMINNIETRLVKVRATTGDEAFLQIVNLANEINDSIEVNNLIKKFHPEPATNLACEVKGSEIILSWKASSSIGDIQYCILRKKNSFSNDDSDGELIYSGTELYFTDGALSKSEEYCYTVFAKRHNILSVGCKSSKPIVILPTLESVKAIGGDGIVTLSWKNSKTVSEIKVWKSESEQRPETTNQCERILCNRIDGLGITDLQNGKKYWFMVVAHHNIDGNIYVADAIITSAVPQKPAKPLEDFNVSLLGTKYTATWLPSDWDVILFYSIKKPKYLIGNIYDIDEILADYQKVDIQIKSITEASFDLNFTGQCYIIPGVINAKNVILNEPYCLSNISNVEQVSFDTNAAGNELYINFNWPKKFTKVAVAYRFDTYPEGPDDSLAKCFDCTKQQYDYDAAVLLQNPKKGIYYVTIYTVFETDERKLYSSGVQIIINNEPQRDIYYSFSYKKAFLSKKCVLTFSAKSDEKFILPQFVLTAKHRGMPLTRDDGFVVASVLEETTSNTSFTFTFNVEPIQADTYIKMFFVNDKFYRRFKLMNDGTSKV